MPSLISRAIHALDRIASRVRHRSEFSGLVSALAPRPSIGPYSWDLKTIRAARDAQLRGDFYQPAKMARGMRTEGALFNAYHNRIAPQQALETRIIAAPGARGTMAARRAHVSVFTPRSTLADLHGDLVNHGIAIGHNIHEPSDDGTRIDFRHECWPIEFVKWNVHKRCLETRTELGPVVDIRHGDGEWVVYRKFATDPWAQEACLLPAAFLWCALAEGGRDWAQASRSHGNSKLVGEMKEGISLKSDDGVMTPEAASFLRMMADLASGESSVALRPAGAKTEFLSNDSTAWQVFQTLIENREKIATRIYLGTDAILGSVGGAPGVDISALFGITTTKLQGDLNAIEQGLRTGVFEPWAALNFGDSQYAPALKYQTPDPDAEKKADQDHKVALQRAERRQLLLERLSEYRAQGFVVTQEVVDTIACELDVKDPPTVAARSEKVVPLDVAPTDAAKTYRVRDIRSAKGLGPLGPELDDLLIPQLDAYFARIEAPAPAPAPAPVAPAPVA